MAPLDPQLPLIVDELRRRVEEANTYSNLGRYDQALALQEEVLTGYRTVFPPDHPDVLMAIGSRH